MKVPLRILHLEDEPFDTELVEGLLIEAGLAVEIKRVDTMPEYVQAMCARQYALILADYKLPGVDPVEALLRARQQCPDVPFVFFSGMIGEERAVEVLRLGASDCVSKSSQGRLVPAIQRALHEAEEHAFRKKAEDKMRVQSSALQAAANAILISDRDGVVQWVNAAFERLSGYSAAEVFGQNPRILKSGKHPSEFYEQMWETVIEGRVWHSELMNKHKDGSLYQEEMTITPVKNREGQISHFIAIMQDITQRKEREQELQDAREKLTQANIELETKVQERTARLNEIIAELEAFSYSLSHDMRAPLRTITGYAEIIKTEHRHEISDAVVSLIEKIEQGSGRIDELIADVLSLTRISRTEPHTDTIDVEELIRQVINLRPDMQPPKAEVSIQSPLALVQGDRASLTQCVTNLLSNAIKFVRTGVTPQIRIGTETLHASPDTFVRLWISDNGIGIAPESQSRIFELFQRLNRQDQYEGTGIGLAIVKKAVERMGGRVGLESQVGKGSTFWVELPKPAG